MSNFDGDLAVGGNLSCRTFSAPASCIGDAAVATPAGAAAGLSASKLNHRHHVPYSQPEGTAVVTESKIVRIINGAVGNTNSMKAILKVANIGAATVTIDLKKNGTSVLSSPISFSSSDAALAIKSATISTAASAAGDYFEMVVTATAGGGTLGQGMYVETVMDEYPS